MNCIFELHIKAFAALAELENWKMLGKQENAITNCKTAAVEAEAIN